jgi:hypothetical protein
MELIIGFFLGIVATITGFMLYAMITVRKLKAAKKNIVDELRKKLDEQDAKRESIIARLKQAQAITEQQLDIRAATDQPSKNALHSRYKNGLISDIKKLEEEKIAILQSILNDGFDPTISVIDETGQKQELPLSHFVSKAAATTPPPTPDPNAPKRVGKFVVVKGGKDDGTVH